MRYLKRYELFGLFSKEGKIKRICRKYGISNYTINSDGFIDVDDNVDLTYKFSEKLLLKFVNVSGDFYCYGNRLTNLEGCPESVGGNFSCSYNKLTSLEGCPRSVGDTFNCISNQIDTFEGLDFIHIGREFYCDWNPIYGIWKLFKDHTKFEFFNDCDIIRENRVIILDRLNFFLDYIGKETVTGVKGYKCI